MDLVIAWRAEVVDGLACGLEDVLLEACEDTF